ncbi:hypothetical protein P3W45_000717 [Vairimorpha bombi]
MEGLALVWFEAMIEDEVDSYTEFKKHFGKKFFEEFLYEVIKLNKRAKLEKEEICNFFAKWFPVSLQERARGSFSYEELVGYTKSGEKKKIICFTCEGDHYRNKCPLDQRKSEIRDNVSLKNSRIMVPENGLVCTRGYVLVEERKILLDMGASQCFIDKSISDSTKLNIEGKIRVETTNGNKSSLGVVLEKIQLGETFYLQEFIVMIARRLMFLSDLDFVIEYKKGCSNLVADFVSRVQLKKNETERSDISNVVLEAHQITGHSCPGNTYDFLLKQGVREGIAKARVKDILKTCTTCLKFKKQSKFKSCPTRIDGTFLKWVEGKALKQKSAKEIARFLVEDIFTRHGVVKEIRSDQGLEFNNQLVRAIAKFFNSKIKYSSPYHPQSNGLAERTNQTIINKLSKATEDYKLNWDRLLPYVLLQYKISIIEKLKASPFMLLYGRHPIVPRELKEIPKDFDVFFSDPIDYLRNKTEILRKQENRIKSNNERMISRTKKLNEYLKDPEDLAVGTQVLLRKHNSLLKKSESPYRELYEVIENKGQGAYKIRNKETHTEYYTIWKWNRFCLRGREHVDVNMKHVDCQHWNMFESLKHVSRINIK